MHPEWSCARCGHSIVEPRDTEHPDPEYCDALLAEDEERAEKHLTRIREKRRSIRAATS